MKIKQRLMYRWHYLFAGMISILVAIVAYVNIANITFEDAVTREATQLTHKQELMDSVLINIQSTGYAITTNPSVAAFANKSSITGADMASLRNTVTGMSIGNTIFDPMQRQILSGYYIFFQDSGLVMNIRDKTAMLTSTWQPNFQIDGLTSEEWFNIVFSKDASDGFIPRVSLCTNRSTWQDMSLYLQPYPAGSENPKAMVVFALDMERFANLLAGQQIKGESISLIDNSSGRVFSTQAVGENLIASAKNLENHSTLRIRENGKDSVLFKADSAYTNWSIVRQLPADSITSASSRLQLSISLSIGAVILFAILMLIIAAYMNNKPIREISRMLLLMDALPPLDWEKPNASPKGITDVSHGVRQLIDLNQSIQVDLEGYRNRLRENMLERLLEGKLLRRAEIEECARLLDSLFCHQAFAVLLLRIDVDHRHATDMDIENVYLQRLALLHHLRPEDNEIVHLMQCTDEIAIIRFAGEEETPEALSARAAGCIGFLRSKGYTNVRIGIGGVCRRSIDLSLSLEQGRIALSLASQGELVACYDKQKHVPADSYFYPLEEERRLYNTVRSGNETEAQQVLESIYEENFNKRLLSSIVLEQLIQEMHGTYNKLVGSLPDGESVPAQPRMQISFSDSSFNKIGEKIIGLCERFCECRPACGEHLVQQIIAYIEMNYTDPGLSLAMLADQFSISEAYLSRIFKEQSGENLTTCLERTRMQHAERMLVQTRIPIQEIVQRVGYTHYDTFRKAFKRFYSVKPSEYRSLAASEDQPLSIITEYQGETNKP